MAYNPNETDCNYTLPVYDDDDVCEVFNDELINQLRFGYFGKPLISIDPTSNEDTPGNTARAAEWADRLDNAATRTEKPDAIRFREVPNFVLPPADPATKTTASGKTISGKETIRQITGVVDNDSDATYAFWSQFSEQTRTVLLWFNSGPHTYGGRDGLEATILASYKINPDGVGHSWTITISFKQRGALKRHLLLV